MQKNNKDSHNKQNLYWSSTRQKFPLTRTKTAQHKIRQCEITNTDSLIIISGYVYEANRININNSNNDTQQEDVSLQLIIITIFN